MSWRLGLENRSIYLYLILDFDNSYFSLTIVVKALYFVVLYFYYFAKDFIYKINFKKLPLNSYGLELMSSSMHGQWKFYDQMRKFLRGTCNVGTMKNSQQKIYIYDIVRSEFCEHEVKCNKSIFQRQFTVFVSLTGVTLRLGNPRPSPSSVKKTRTRERKRFLLSYARTRRAVKVDRSKRGERARVNRNAFTVIPCARRGQPCWVYNNNIHYYMLCTYV